MNIESYDLDDLLKVLKPYQQELINQLINQYGVEEAIDKWIIANGPSDIVKFGGDSNNGVSFVERYKIEINKLICGHPDYSEYRVEYSKLNESAKTFLISSISSLIGSKLGVAATAIAPVVVLSIYLIGKMGVKAYCANVSFE